jgi:lipopolysaccharide biosynthesis protein
MYTHFHTKKSNDNESGVGDRWRKYLLGNLLGSVSAANQILGMFDDDHVGMVFAEDAHSTDEGENRPFIEAMLKLLELEAKDVYHIFPVGTMFWARTDALALLDQLPEDYFKLSEPVPYDGSTLHAFERLLPQLVEAQGYNVKRVYTRW